MQHNIFKFDCGESLVNDFLHNDSVIYENQNLRSTTIFYSTDNMKIIGYYTTASSIIEVRSHYDVAKFGNKISTPEDNPLSASFPAIEICWFGIDVAFQGQHLGTSLMMSLFGDLVKARYAYGVGFSDVILSSLPGAVEFYQKYGFDYLHVDYDNLELMPETYPMFIETKKLTEIYQHAIDLKP